VRVGRRVRVQVAPGAAVTLGDGCVLGDGCRLHVAAGRVEIDDGAVLGERCVIAAHRDVRIGAGARLGDRVVLVDFDHGVADVEAPMRVQPLLTAAVVVGPGARVGHGASLLRGVTVGAHAEVGEHAVVTADVAPGAAVGGVPARAL
jgi:acetyltransferase-like isoleucine patch superfamily enzyme